MKSVPQGAGNSKLRGKLSRSMSCGCCVMENWKWRERVKEANKEIYSVFKEFESKSSAIMGSNPNLRVNRE